MPNNHLTFRQQKYIRHLREQLLSEFNYLNDTIAGRATRRTKFVENFLGLIQHGGDANAAFTALGVAMPIVLAVKASSVILGRTSAYLYNASQINNITPVAHAAVDTSKTALELLINEVAEEAAHLYSYAINILVDDAGIAQFAMVGALRITDYLILQKSTVLYKETLLTGLVRGNSGAGIYGFMNNDVTCHNNQILSAEDLYARAAYRTPDGRLWANVDRTNNQIIQRTQRYTQKLIGKPHDSHFGWVKTDDQGMPLCGYRFASYEEVQALDYEVFTIDPQSNFAKQSIVHKPTMRWVDATDIASYMRARHKGYYYNFNHYIGAHARFNGVLSNIDLSFGDFSHSDFSDTIFIDCKIDHADFSNARLVRCQLLGKTSAINIKLKSAQCAYLQAPEISFFRSDLDGANFYKANLQRADIRKTTRVDSRWEETDEKNLKKGDIYHQEDSDTFNPYAVESGPLYKQLEKNPENIALLQQWLGAYLRPTLIKHLDSSNASFAILGICDVALINGQADAHLECILITSENKTATQEEQVNQAAPFIQKALHSAMVTLKSIGISIDLTFYKKSPEAPSTLQQLCRQQAFLLGGNFELYTQYINALRSEKSDIHKALTTHIKQPGDTKNTLYYLASFYNIEWAPIKELLNYFVARQLIHPQLAEDLTFCLVTPDIWPEFSESIQTLWYDIINEATQTSSLQLFSNHPIERLQVLNNFQRYFIYCSFRLKQAQDDASRQLVIQAWQSRFQQLTQTQQQQWMDQLAQQTWPDANLKITLFNCLLMVSRSNGWHYNLEYYREQWLMNWRNLLSQDAPNDHTVVLNFPGGDAVQTRSLSPQILTQFLEAGQFKTPNNNQLSMHAVYRIEHAGRIYWGKPAPEQPASELALVELMKRLIGKAFLPETLITACHIPNRPPIAIQWSENMPGQALEASDLAEIWQEDPLLNLSDESWLAHLFRVIITCPEDESGKHLHRVKRTDGKIDLFAIDLDRCFFKPNDRGYLGFNKTLQVKSIILCFNQMQEPLNLKHPVIQRFIKLDAHALLEDWLESSINVHKTYAELFDDPAFTMHFNSPQSLFTLNEIKHLMPQAKPSLSFLTLQLGGELLVEINKRIGLMQSVLKRHWHDNTPITGLEFLIEVHPELGANYQSMFTDVSHTEQGFTGLSREITSRAVAVFKKPIDQLPEHLLPLLRFWERTRKEYTYVAEKKQNQTTQTASTAVSASLRLDSPLTLPQAKSIRAGQSMSPLQAKAVMQTLRTQRGFEIIACLKLNASISKEEVESLIASFHMLSSRQKKSLLKAEVDVVNRSGASLEWQTRILNLLPGTPLHDLDLSGFADVLTDEVLYSILTTDCAGKYIKSLNLSNCKKITDKAIQYIADNCPKLTTLNLDKTAITSISASYLFSAIFSLEKFRLYFKCLENLSAKLCRNLTTIEITAPNLIKLSTGHATHVDKIVISGVLNIIDFDFSCCNQLTEYNESYVFFDEFQTMLRHIKINNHARWSLMDRQENILFRKGIDDADFNIIMNSLQIYTNITYLTLNGCLSNEHVECISMFLSNNMTIKIIDFGYNYHGITNEGAVFIAEMLKTNTTIQNLMLNHNQITNAGMSAIFCALKTTNRTLKNINVDHNTFLSVAFHEITMVIIENKTIEIISLLGIYVDDSYKNEFIHALLINRIVQIKLSYFTKEEKCNDEDIVFIANLESRSSLPSSTNVPVTLEWIKETRSKEFSLQKIKESELMNKEARPYRNIRYLRLQRKQVESALDDSFRAFLK